MLDPESTAIQIVTNAMGSFTFDTRGLSSSAEANLQDITGRQKHSKHGNLLSEIYQTSLYARSSQEYNRALMKLAQKKSDEDLSALGADQRLGSRRSLSSSLSGGSIGSLSSSRDSSSLSSSHDSRSLSSSSSTTRPAPRLLTLAGTSGAAVVHHRRFKAPTTRHTHSSSSGSSSNSNSSVTGVPGSSNGSKGGPAGMKGVQVTPFRRGAPPRSKRFAGQESHVSSSSNSSSTAGSNNGSNRGQTGIQGVTVTPLRRVGRSGVPERHVSSSSSSTAGSSNGSNGVQAGVQGVDLIPLRLRERFSGRESQVSSSNDAGGSTGVVQPGGQQSSEGTIDYTSLDKETLLELFQWRWTTDHLS